MSVLNGIVVVLGIVSALVSGVVVFFCYAFRPLHHAEIEGMKREGRFEGEPEYMQQFRVTRAEFDLEANQRHTRWAWVWFLVSIGLTLAAVFVR